MTCVSRVSFAILINGARSHFSKASRGLRHGFLLSSYLFLIVDGLSHALEVVKSLHLVRGLRVGRNKSLMDLLFVDDILILFLCESLKDRKLKEVLDLFCDVTGMLINVGKLAIFSIFFGGGMCSYSTSFSVLCS